MATLQTIRSKGPLLVVVIGLALFAFIAGDAWKVLQPHQGKQDVGEVNGKTLTAQEYQKMVDEYTEVIKLTQGVSALNDDQLTQVKDQVWQSYVNNQLIAAEAAKLGLTVSKAEVLYHTDENGKKLEPMELAYVDVPDEFTGAVIEKLSQRKGEMLNMKPITGGYTRLEFNIPSRGLIGYRGEFMTDTKGNGIINTIFNGYAPYKGEIAYRKLGSLIAFETGESVTYGLFSAQDRGTLFIGPGEKVYAGMVIGSSSRAEDIELNVCKKKHLTNTRSSSADEALTLVPPKILSLEQALDFIDVDELLEVTPESLRIRKRILDPTLRKRAGMKK